MKEIDCTSRRISQYTQKELEKHFATGRWVLISSSRQVSHSIQNTKHILNGGWPSKCPHSAPTSSPPAANETAPPRNSNLQGESVKQMHTEIPAFFRFRKPRNAHKQEQTGIALALFVSLKTALLLKACSLRKEAFFCKGSIYVYIYIYKYKYIYINIYIYICVCDFIYIYIYILYMIVYVCPLFSLVHFSIHPMTNSFLDALEEARERIPPAVAGRLASSENQHLQRKC